MWNISARRVLFVCVSVLLFVVVQEFLCRIFKQRDGVSALHYLEW